MLSKVKNKILFLLQVSRFFHFTNLLYRRKIRIFAYHRFGEKYVTARSFAKQLNYLKSYFDIIDLNCYLSAFENPNKLPSYPVMITIDDGYEDFYKIAFPILKKYSVPATVFLTVDFIDKRKWLWHDILNFAIHNTSLLDFRLEGNMFDLTNDTGRAELKLYLDRTCTSLSTVERDAFIEHILKELKVTISSHPTSDYAPLSWNQILEMAESGISFGAHTCTHPILSRIPCDQARVEISESKRRIEEVLQKDVLAFCYPNGKEHDFNHEIKSMVRESGFFCAFSMIYGINSLYSDRYALRRIGIDGRSFINFIHDASCFGLLTTALRRVR